MKTLHSLRSFVGWLLAVAVFVGLSGHTRDASAQVYADLGPAPVIGGVQVQCGGVPALVANIPDLALAQSGRILLRPDFFQLPAVVQLFTYAHECAHLVAVGPNEAAADCWAVGVGRAQGWLDEQGLDIVARYFINSPGDWTHAPGQWRVRHMWECMQSS